MNTDISKVSFRCKERVVRWINPKKERCCYVLSGLVPYNVSFIPVHCRSLLHSVKRKYCSNSNPYFLFLFFPFSRQFSFCVVHIKVFLVGMNHQGSRLRLTFSLSVSDVLWDFVQVGKLFFTVSTTSNDDSAISFFPNVEPK